MERFTQAQRAMVHLYKHRDYDIYSNVHAPYEVTQNGIGEALGISRSYASLLMNRMEDDGLIYKAKSLVQDGAGRVQRNVYSLSPRGRQMCELMIGDRDADDIIPRNLNHCRLEDFDSLDGRTRDLLGSLMLIRGPVRVDQVPGGKGLPLLPFDYSGLVTIRDSTRARFLHHVDKETVRRWHSIAADWCSDNSTDLCERMEHLTAGGRHLEATKLVLANPYTILDGAGPDTASSLETLSKSTGRKCLAVMAAYCYMKSGRTVRANRALAASEGCDPCIRGAITAEVMLAEGRPQDALAKALDSYRGDAPTALALGRCMAANGRNAEATVYLRKCRRCMTETKCLFRLDEVLRQEAECRLALGDRGTATRLLRAASCAARDDRTGRLLRMLADRISEDRGGLEGVEV